MSKIIDIEIIDLRVPTSDTLQGSDPFHKKPNYSCVLTRINTDDGLLGLSVNFSAGAGNDWLAYGVRDLSRLILGGTWRNLSGTRFHFIAFSLTITSFAGWRMGWPGWPLDQSSMLFGTFGPRQKINHSGNF